MSHIKSSGYIAQQGKGTLLASKEDTRVTCGFLRSHSRLFPIDAYLVPPSLTLNMRPLQKKKVFWKFTTSTKESLSLSPRMQQSRQREVVLKFRPVEQRYPGDDDPAGIAESFLFVLKVAAPPVLSC